MVTVWSLSEKFHTYDQRSGYTQLSELGFKILGSSDGFILVEPPPGWICLAKEGVCGFGHRKDIYDNQGKPVFIQECLVRSDGSHEVTVYQAPVRLVR